jgi:hypothetical protein
LQILNIDFSHNIDYTSGYEIKKYITLPAMTSYYMSRLVFLDDIIFLGATYGKQFNTNLNSPDNIIPNTPLSYDHSLVFSSNTANACYITNPS